MITVRQLVQSGTSSQRKDGTWLPHLPCVYFFEFPSGLWDPWFWKIRVKDAWLVLIGGAHAIVNGD